MSTKIKKGSWVIVPTDKGLDRDVGRVLSVAGDSAKVHWYISGETYTEDVADLREIDEETSDSLYSELMNQG